MKHSDWKSIRNVSDLDVITKQSHLRPIVLFKHSTRCGISASAEHRLSEEWNKMENKLDFYHLDLLVHRDISNAIAERFGVVHQSPQVIILNNGEVVGDTSHHMISVDYLNNIVASIN